MHTLTAPPRYSLLAHEPALRPEGGGDSWWGGASYAVAEQAEAVHAFLKRHATGSASAALSIVCPRPDVSAHTSGGVPMRWFDAPDASLDELASLYVEDGDWLDLFASWLGDKPVLAHHLPAARIAEALSLPTVCALHSLWPAVQAAFTDSHGGPRADACDSLLSSSAAILVATEAERAWLLSTATSARETSGLASRVHVVAQGVSPYLMRFAARMDLPKRREALRARLLPGVDPSDVVLYVAGRLVRYKHTLEVIQAFARVAHRIPRSRLLVVGPPTDAAYAAECAEAARDLPTDVARRIALVGPQRLEVAPLVGDVLIHASRNESWGRTIDEAMVLGRPAVIHATPFVAEKVGCPWPPDETAASDRALWIDATSPHALEDALVRAAEDAGWRRACGSAHRVRAATLGWDGPVRDLLDVWNDVEWDHRGTRPFHYHPAAERVR